VGQVVVLKIIPKGRKVGRGEYVTSKHYQVSELAGAEGRVNTDQETRLDHRAHARKPQMRVGCAVLILLLLGLTTIVAAAVPATPTNPSPGTTSVPGPMQPSTNVTLSWSGVTGATYYSLGVRDMATNALVVDTTTSGTSYPASLATTGGQYRWNVAACNTSGCSSYTTPLYFQTPGVVPGTLVLGVDVYSDSSPVEWSQVRNAGGKRFAFVKATSGVLGEDAQFLTYMADIKRDAPDLLVGAYHFAYPNYTSQNTGTAEAQHFLAVAGDHIGPGYLPPVLDIEDDDVALFWYPARNLTAAQLVQWIKDWAQEIEQQKHVKPIIYTTRWYAQFLNSDPSGKDLSFYPLWIATYPQNPTDDPGNIGAWSTWTFQQYRTDPVTQGPSTFEAGTCPGIYGTDGYADLDSFNGDITALIQLTQPSATTGPSLMITSHSNNQHVTTSSIKLAGTASDSGNGDNGIQQVTVNGVRANNDTASGSGTANWSRVVSLSGGANGITVIAYDNSPNHNTTTQSITIYYDIQAQYSLTVVKAGTGDGTVTGSPAGINCGSDCTEAYKGGTKITLTAKADTDSTFTGWSGGGCSGTATCTVTMNSDTNVTATFSLVVPTISSSFTGTTWPAPISFTCYDKSQTGYFQVPYEGYPAIYVYANGSNLDKISSVEISASGYNKSVQIIKSKSTSKKLALDIRGSKKKGLFPGQDYYDEKDPIPVTNPTLTFYYENGTQSASYPITPGIIPVFYVNKQAWGQCTWYAGIIKRIESPVYSYSSCTQINGDPNSPGFPKAFSVLNVSDKHMAYLEQITITSTVINTDGSTTITYNLKGSQYNAACDCQPSTFDTNMVVNKSKDGKKYKILTYPQFTFKNGKVYPVTKVKQ